MNIENKIVLVTGASAGIGKAIAREFWDHGAKVALASRNEEKLKEITASWGSDRLMAVRLDVQSEESCREAVSRVAERWGNLDILINNAGVGIYGPVDAIPMQEAQKLFETNFFGATRMCVAAFPYLSRRKESSIVMVSSIAGKRGVPWMNYYCATKGAMNLFSESLRMEWGNYGIKITVVMPGITESEFGSNSRYFGGVKIPSVIPVKHTARDVAVITRKAVEKGQREVIVGLKNRLMVCAQTTFAPIVERFLGRLFGPWDRLSKHEAGN